MLPQTPRGQCSWSPLSVCMLCTLLPCTPPPPPPPPPLPTSLVRGYLQCQAPQCYHRLRTDNAAHRFLSTGCVLSLLSPLPPPLLPTLSPPPHPSFVAICSARPPNVTTDAALTIQLSSSQNPLIHSYTQTQLADGIKISHLSIHPSIRQSINQPINQSANQSIN